MKKLLCTLLALSMLLGLAACGGPAPAEGPSADPAPAVSTAAQPEDGSASFTDSVGRTVEVPAEITSVAVSGPLAQMVLFALCPDKLVGIADEWDASAEQYLATEYYNLPLLGQLYGGKGELNLETLLGSGAQVVIDVGEPKDTIVEDLDALQEQTGIPFVHVSATIETMGDAYRKLGELLGMEEAETPATYCDETYAMAVGATSEHPNCIALCIQTKLEELYMSGIVERSATHHPRLFVVAANDTPDEDVQGLSAGRRRTCSTSPATPASTSSPRGLTTPRSLTCCPTTWRWWTPPPPRVPETRWTWNSSCCGIPT